MTELSDELLSLFLFTPNTNPLLEKTKINLNSVSSLSIKMAVNTFSFFPLLF